MVLQQQGQIHSVTSEQLPVLEMPPGNVLLLVLSLWICGGHNTLYSDSVTTDFRRAIRKKTSFRLFLFNLFEES